MNELKVFLNFFQIKELQNEMEKKRKEAGLSTIVACNFFVSKQLRYL
jgi:hypothetical protein